MRQEYQEIIKTVCKSNNIRDLSREEREGAFGVALLLAFLKGVNPYPEDFARHLGVSKEDIDLPYKRLLAHGIFSQRYAAREDEVLLGACSSSHWIEASDRTRNAWAIIAGISSGYTGLREETKK